MCVCVFSQPGLFPALLNHISNGLQFISTWISISTFSSTSSKPIPGCFPPSAFFLFPYLRKPSAHLPKPETWMFTLPLFLCPSSDPFNCQVLLILTYKYFFKSLCCSLFQLPPSCLRLPFSANLDDSNKPPAGPFNPFS